jgi:hypothetical protein
MKKYLFGSGAMLVGAGLMFVLMHGKVNAAVETDRCDRLFISTFKNGENENIGRTDLSYCKVRDLTCIQNYNGGISCVKTKG